MNFHLPAPLSFPRFLIYSPKSPKSLFSFFLLNCFFTPSPLFSPQPLFRSSCRLLQWTPSSPSSPNHSARSSKPSVTLAPISTSFRRI
ncbi:hypothetical protein I3843_01G130900 [Carya illinoinensis]|nr:hypothetical protein I3843_01G130900 [Carya illinoinensis]